MSTNHESLHSAAGKALKTLALNPELRAAFESSPLFRSLLVGPASRYILPEAVEETISRLLDLRELGYRLGIERVGEDIDSRSGVDLYVRDCEAFVSAYAATHDLEMQFGFDLSALGLNIGSDLAYRNARHLAELCAERSMTVIISMERSEKTSEILRIFTHLAADNENVAITLPAQLDRSVDDLPALIDTGAKIRLVKGVYIENPDTSLERGRALDRRYLAMVEQAVGQGSRVACATQDPRIVDALDERDLISSIEEVEMLHGVNSALMKTLRARGVNTRVTCVYGTNWYLHFLHRLAESPENVITALADLQDPDNIRNGY